MSRTCLFCDGAPLSREHVWPGWARSLFPDGLIVEHERTAEFAGSEPERRVFPQQLFDQTTRIVCATCNNGWMSQLEDANKPFLLAALSGRGRDLHAGGQRQLAAWAFKTALVLNRGVFRQYSTGMPDAHAAHLFQHREPPPDVGIWLSAYQGKEAAVVANNGMAISRPGEVVTDADDPNFYLVTFSLGPVLMQVCGASEPDDINIDPTGFEYRSPSIRRLWPPVDRSFTWSNSPAITSDDLPTFSGAIHNAIAQALADE